jgi:ubiquinone/menaquinone biosynthesis C-methylase UbiE
MSVWNLYERTYEKLWVQHISLRPTRKAVIGALKKLKLPGNSLLDMSCGTGQLLDDLKRELPEIECVGVEPSLMRRTAISKGHKILDSDVENFNSSDDFGCIVCTHAFPYYSDQREAIFRFSEHTLQGGYLIIAHAQTKSIYDKLMLMIVKLTTSKAHYPTHSDMVDHLEPYYKICEVVKINAWYVPSITMYIAQKR